MKHFFEHLAQRVAKGRSGLLGNEFTFAQAWHARDLEAALRELSIPCAVIKVGQQHKVRLAEMAVAETGGQAIDQLVEKTASPEAAPADDPSPAEPKGVMAMALR